MPFPPWLEDGWCAIAKPFCATVWWCGPTNWFALTLGGASLWIGLFYAFAFVLYPLVERRLQTVPSKYKEENTRYWFAWHIVSVIHSCTVTAMCAAPVYRLASASRNVQLASPYQLEIGFSEAIDHATCGNASHVFSCFVLYDVVVISLHSLAKSDMLIHHAIFFSFCTLVQYNCFLGYLAGWMMLMEISTIFLNYFSFFRNRLGLDSKTVQATFAIFSATYLVLRVFCMGNVVRFYAVNMFSEAVDWKSSGVGGVPVWHLNIVFMGVVAAWVLQLGWFVQGIRPKLAKIFGYATPVKSAD
eukprot:TRINITY_DN18537_c0_g1_i2.p1 TRINITY_DN18537_c0_g1~~TRINITY_DN18537_c0_g1_i2.p1  ORF type:complete len:301 (-),score=40.34 TRINITY_DN18537_c0_g1_i2:248-1150(-)